MDEVVLVHSSDLHVQDDAPHGLASGAPGAGLEGLRLVLAAAVGADLLLLAGDTFDSARVSPARMAAARALLAAAPLPVVVLPGNHDALQPDCLYRRAGLLELPHVTVLGATHEAAVSYPSLGLEVWGRTHRGSSALLPLADPPPRRSRWQVAMAHGHYVPDAEARWHEHRAWRITDAALGAVEADYVALGHWDRWTPVGSGRPPACYSGSPDLAGSVNLVRLGRDGLVRVSREPLRAGAF